MFSAVLFVIFMAGNACKFERHAINDMAFEARKNDIIEKYPKIPNEAILIQSSNSNKLYDELKDRYRETLIHLKGETDNDGAKMVVVIMSAEVGKNISLANTYGIPFILETCSDLGIDCIDLSQAIIKDSTELTLQGEPYWNKAGAAFIASQLGMAVIEKNTDYKSTKISSNTKMPETFGDFAPNYNEVLQDEKNIPYHIIANTQGLRMNRNLIFPKTKQRILFLGGASIFQPYLDNEKTSTNLLQMSYPDKDIVNAGKLNYSMDDYETLYLEKARFMQPDIVVVCTTGNDVLDYYFSARNQYTRAKQLYMPSENELAFYKTLYPAKEKGK